MAFEAVHKLKHAEGMVPLNYKVRVNTDFCIGCGVCAYRCPSKSLVLLRNETITHPPKDAREWVKLVATDFAAARSSVHEKGAE